MSASSSGDGPRPIAGLAEGILEDLSADVAPPFVRNGAIQVELVAHEGIVHLDDHGAFAILCNSTTLEREVIPGAGWSLEFDDEGFAALANKQTDEVRLVEEECITQLDRSKDEQMRIFDTTSRSPRMWARSTDFKGPLPARSP